ncbi:MAG: T9SS type A sorting domain-containing protein [Bacteroidetes bacterium]|nr:T9SS type A sorting domain-containing protein [Bacteroidota bacterium]
MTNKTTESTTEIYDLMGKKVWDKISSENRLEIDISSQPKGIYLVKVVNENQVTVQKIIYD